MASRSWLQAAKDLLHGYPEILVSVTCFFVFNFYFQCHGRRRRSNIPVNWPFIGMLPGIVANLSNVHDWITNFLSESGGTFSFTGPWLLGMDYLLTSDPADIQFIFNSNFANYPKGEEFAEIFDILGDGIFNADDDSWRSQRMKAHSLISSGRFRSFVAKSIRSKVEKGLLPVLDRFAQQRAEVDLQDVFLRLTFDSTFDLVFGTDPCCLSVEFPTVPFAKAMDDAMEALFLRHTVPPAWWKLQRWLSVGQEKKLAEAKRVIDRFIAESIESKKKLASKKVGREINEAEAKVDLISSYVNDADDGSKQGTDVQDKFIRDTALNFMLAGRDTTGAALTWFTWLLSKNPAAERKILEEIRLNCITSGAAGAHGRLTTFDPEEVSKLVYLHAALCEALRLYPPVPFEQKAAVRAEQLPSGRRAEVRRKILVSIYSMGRMEGIWGKDCSEFKPERWISEKGRVRYEPAYKFLSFNSGPRTCLGKEVAFTQMKTVAAAIVYNFEVEAVRGHEVEPKLSIILHMRNGLKVRVKRRSAACAV